jgi:sugar transferase (PEP-CTERM/EpsH1 system associated)
MKAIADRPQHVVHVLYRFAAGGLENVLVQIINGLPRSAFRHTLVVLTEADPAFAARIERDDVEIICLHKPPGQPFGLYPSMFRLLRRLQPDVVHTCNIAALEFMPVAWLARVPLRIHAEHGWDIADPDGSNVRYRMLRRFYARFVNRVVTVSELLQTYWATRIGLSSERLQLIPNGVDCMRFRPRRIDDPLPNGWPFRRGEHYVIGTVGRLEPIKNHRLLVDAFIELAALPGNEALRLAIVGGGPLREPVTKQMREAGMEERLWLPGSRADIPDILRALDCFVLPSLAEGTSCTLLEAMSVELPIVATAVGGNVDLLQDGRYGYLVPSDDVTRLVAAIAESRTIETRGLAARQAVLELYGLDRMLARYQTLFASP